MEGNEEEEEEERVEEERSGGGEKVGGKRWRCYTSSNLDYL